MNLPISIQSTWPGMLLVTLPLLFWLSSRSRTRLGRKHLRVATLLRSLAIIALALALMRPQWTAQSSDVSVVYALDVSQSVSAQFIDGAIDWIERADRAGAPAQARYLAFADHPVMVHKAQDLRAVAVTQDGARAAVPAANVIDRSATDLEQALDVALTGLDRNHARRIVLLTDGNQPAGDIWRVLPRLKQAQVRVFAIPATVREANDAWIAGIDAPADIHAGEPVSVIVRVVCGVDTPGEVRLSNGNIRLGS
ncbi:MAG TPA: VWA domain-containing protein, partial [Burkholderiales bacterium]